MAPTLNIAPGSYNPVRHPPLTAAHIRCFTPLDSTP